MIKSPEAVAQQSDLKTARAPVNRQVRRRRDAQVGLGFVAPFAVLFVLVFVIPIVVSIRQSFYQRTNSGGGLFGGGEPLSVCRTTSWS